MSDRDEELLHQVVTDLRKESNGLRELLWETTKAAEEENAKLKEQLANIGNGMVKTLQAKWLDPMCHDGCKSLILKERLRIAREALEIVKPYLANETHAGAFAVSKALDKLRETEEHQ